jgi:hypothetical protein
MTRGGFTCGRLAMIHSSRVRTEFLLDAAAPLGVSSLRKLPSSSKNSCSGARARPMPSSPPATHIFRPRLRCELAKETAHGKTSCRKTCCPRFPEGRCMRSTREVPPFSPSVEFDRVSLSSERGSVGGVLLVSPGATFVAYITMNAISASLSLSGSHVPGTLTGSSRGRSARAQSSTRPPAFSTGVGNALHAPPCTSPSLPEVCSVCRVAATSLMTTASSSSREHASNSVRCLQNSSGVRPCNVVK